MLCGEAQAAVRRGQGCCGLAQSDRKRADSARRAPPQDDRAGPSSHYRVSGRKLTGLSPGIRDMPGSQSHRRLQPSTTQQQGLPVPPRWLRTQVQCHPNPTPHTPPTLPSVCRWKEPKKGCAHPACPPGSPRGMLLGRHLGQESATCLPASSLFRLKDNLSMFSFCMEEKHL